MGRTKEQQAAYMREYRQRKAQDHAAYDRMKPTIGAIKTDASARIRELEEEVRHLKAELAKRPTLPAGELRPVVAEPIGHAFNSRPFTPVPRRRLPKAE